MSRDNFLDSSQYLSALDPEIKNFTFQTFDDTDRSRSDLAHIFHGPLAQHWGRLYELNRKRAGVYVAVQETDLMGRKQANIRNIRSVFADDDKSMDIASLPLEPSMVVNTSPGKHHLYYLLNSKMSTANGNKEKFAGIMRGLVAKGADPGCQSIERALRLPGFHNCKYRDPFYIKGPQINTDFLDEPLRYDFSELAEVYKPPAGKSRIIRPKAVVREPFRVAYAASALYKISPDCDYNEWFSVGAALHYESSGSSIGYNLFYEWSKGGREFKNHDWPTQWDRFSSDGRDRVITMGTLVHIAREYGFDGRYDLGVPGISSYIRQEQEEHFRHMNRRYALIPVQHGMRILYQEKDPLGYFGYHLWSKQAAELYFASKRVPEIKYMSNPDNNRVEQVPLFDRWTKWEGRRYYAGFSFEPSADISMGENPKDLKDGRRYNTYIGLTNEGRDVGCALVLDHIKEVWCKGHNDRYEYVLNWLARMFQEPGKPAETMIILKSKHGAGKNIILDPLIRAFGRYGKTDKAGDDMTSDFNAILMDSVFILVGEASFDSTSKQRAVINTLATQERIGATRKFEDTREIRNCVHVICLSNAEVPLAVLPKDRRVYILSCSNRYVGDFTYFAEMKRQIKEEGIMDGFIHYLKNRDIKGYLPMEMPKSEKGVKSGIVADDSRKVHPFIRSALESDNFLFPLDDKTTDGYGMEQTNWLSMDKLYESYRTYCNDLGKKNNGIASKIAFGRKIKEIFGPHAKKKRMSTLDERGIRSYYYELDDIETLRTDFDDYIGAPHDWGEEDDEEEFDFL